jgi:hypothetical protein
MMAVVVVVMAVVVMMMMTMTMLWSLLLMMMMMTRPSYLHGTEGWVQGLGEDEGLHMLLDGAGAHRIGEDVDQPEPPRVPAGKFRQKLIIIIIIIRGRRQYPPQAYPACSSVLYHTVRATRLFFRRRLSSTPGM